MFNINIMGEAPGGKQFLIHGGIAEGKACQAVWEAQRLEKA